MMDLCKLEEACRLINNGKYAELEQLLQGERVLELRRLKAQIDRKLEEAGPSFLRCHEPRN